MKKRSKWLVMSMITSCVLLFANTSDAQISTIVDTSKISYNQLSTMVGLYVYPSKKQTTQQQKQDEFESYKWAVQQTGYDPVNPTAVKSDSTKNTGQGVVVKKAAVGIAAGAAFGDAGTGAAIGAAAGLRQKRMMQLKQEQQAQQAQYNAQQKQEAMLNNYKKAFSASMEGKGYTVK